MIKSVTNYYNLKRSFYKEHARVEQRRWDEIERFLNLHQIKFSGFDLPKPIFSLDEINFPIYIMNELKLQGVQRPTAIQSMTWPVLYSGRDIMCIGLPISSRVLSYICPALVFIKEQSIEVRKQGALVLIVTQTKEVAKEILTNAQMFMHQANCSFSCLFDDENINTQVLHLRDNEPDIIIGNYHRICELLDRELVNLKNVSFLIMDDFYRNRSARLSDEIKRVVNETRTDRQTAIYSRIVPSGLQKSNGDEFQNDAVFICVGNDDIHVPNKELPQSIHICTMAEKKKKLQDIINEIVSVEKNFKILVYANGFKKIRITEKIVKELGIDTFAYERTNIGKRRRAMKEKVYYNFNATPNSVLVASDVVSSKVELPDLNYIINADFPVNLSLYLNRMKMPNIKKYISIFIAEDARHSDRLIYVLNECRQVVPQILYKISEAYTNSGKDVDRMPSLQEIDEGLTKPVEKPIPKPLPPTVCLDSSPETPLISPVQSLASSKIAVVTAPTSDELLVNTSNVNRKSMHNEDEEKDEIDEVEGSSSSPIDNSKLNQISPTNTSQTSSQRVPSKSSAPSSISPTSSNSPSTSNYKRFKSFHNNTNQYNRPSYYQPNRFNKPPQSHLMPSHYASHIPPGSINLTSVQSYYPPQVVSSIPATSYYYNSQMQTTTTSAYYTNNMPYGVYPTDYALYTSNQHQKSAIAAQEGYNPQPLNSSSSIANVKQEPYEPTAQSSSFNEPNQEWNPYFKNPIPFKQEPSEPQINNSMETSSSTSNAANNQDNAITIVSQLLKDKQILNQLEKVAQTFRLN